MVSSQISPAHSRCQLFDAADWSSPLNRKYHTCNFIPDEHPPAHYELLMIQAVQSWDPCWLVREKNEKEKPATRRWIPAGRLNTPNSTTDPRYPRNHPLSLFSPARQDGAQAAKLKSDRQERQQEETTSPPGGHGVLSGGGSETDGRVSHNPRPPSPQSSPECPA